ncbi:hypothetical protein SNOG_01518 [Parastagonospora nodorum SN15]|uniref:Uncharacterized protein n=1 Tax=Phaeosphaeria nodorum (strain SN15 / ATCC MYA-4574 / FGSC 10173) TaxID=321614 RepID=Q0V396_PHANO|nr:hypothetical protein SNOG_01518 [Parastagonospora nodorum SN15]EAT91167.1 hypothetical protein SNOG_01518 [Parastagonospora nodorum SN15]
MSNLFANISSEIRHLICQSLLPTDLTKVGSSS